MIDHLLRRAGFGARADELALYELLSYADAVDRLVDYASIPDTVDSHIGQPGYVGTTSQGPFSPDTVITDARQRWLFRMVHTDRPLQEKMALFWHNYFATGYSKVAGAVMADEGTRLMNGQMEFLRANALGTLRDLLLGIAKDPAMLIWLDGDTNTKVKPQENFGRELMELFSRGVGYYTENDVYAAARVFTGWNLDRSTYTFVYNANAHETSAKTFSFPIYSGGSTTIPARAASAGMQDGIDFINALSVHPETARRVVTKLYTFFVSEAVPPDPNFINALATTYLDNGSAIEPVVRQILMSPQFQDPSVRFTRYSWPVEFVVRAVKETGWTGFSVGSTLSPLINMGQQLFEPPNVAGWVLGQSWFSTGAMLARMNFGSTLALNQKFRLVAAAPQTARANARSLVDYMTARLTVDLDATAAVYNDLIAFVSAGGAWTGSDAQLQTKASGLAHLILGSAEYQFL